MQTLYYNCYYAFLLGDHTKTRLHYDILKDEIKTKNSSVLKQGQFLELKKIKQALDTGSLPRHSWAEESGYIPNTIKRSELLQDDLIKEIHLSKNLLEDIVKDSLYLYNIEHPCPPYGFVDMVYMGQNTVYPIEVKKDQGKHDLIGQICKYGLYHKLRLHLHQYEFVKPITICQSYIPHVMSELKQNGVLPLCYSISKGVVYFS